MMESTVRTGLEKALASSKLWAKYLVLWARALMDKRGLSFAREFIY